MKLTTLLELNTPRAILSEATYHWDKKNGTQLFWDFYAMYYMWGEMGGGLESYYGKSPDIYSPFTGEFWKKHNTGMASPYDKVGEVPHQKSQDVIDRTFYQVLQYTGKALVFYLKRACLLELQHLENYSRIKSILIYITPQITWDDFKNKCEILYPGVDPEFMVRLIGFCYYYSGDYETKYLRVKNLLGDYTSGIEQKNVDKVKSDDEFQTWLSEPIDKDTVDYNKPRDPDISPEDEIPTSDEEIPDLPYEPGENPPINKSKDDPSYTSHDTYWKPKDDKTKINEVGSSGGGSEKVELRVNLQHIRRIHVAMKKAGMTFDDVVNAYRNNLWSSTNSTAFGGDAWGEGMELALDLERMMAKGQWNNESIKDIAYGIDKIYDLNHNTGKLLNKGSVFVDQDTLNKRAKLKSIARMIPHISPLVKQLVIRHLKYVGSNMEDVNLESDILTPCVKLTPIQSKFLSEKMGFKETGDKYVGAYKWSTERRVGKVKRTSHHTTKLYICKHMDGSYTFHDEMMTDLKKFKTLGKVIRHVFTFYGNMLIKGGTTQSKYSSNSAFGIKGGTTQLKSKYPSTSAFGIIGSNSLRKLNYKKEKILNSIGFFWRPASARYRAAALDNNNFFVYAFTTGKFLYRRSVDSNAVFTIFDTFEKMIEAVTDLTKNKLVMHQNSSKSTPAITPKSTPAITPKSGSNQITYLPILKVISSNGFVWDSDIQMYKNPENKTVFVLHKDKSVSIYFSDGKIVQKNSIVELTSYFLNGGYDKDVKDISKEITSDETQISDHNYNTISDDNNISEIIELTPHDANILESCGFYLDTSTGTPTYNNNNNNNNARIIFFNTDMAHFFINNNIAAYFFGYGKNGGDAKYKPFEKYMSGVKNAIDAVMHLYGKKKEDLPPVSEGNIQESKYKKMMTTMLR